MSCSNLSSTRKMRGQAVRGVNLPEKNNHSTFNCGARNVEQPNVLWTQKWQDLQKPNHVTEDAASYSMWRASYTDNPAISAGHHHVRMGGEGRRDERRRSYHARHWGTSAPAAPLDIIGGGCQAGLQPRTTAQQQAESAPAPQRLRQHMMQPANILETSRSRRRERVSAERKKRSEESIRMKLMVRTGSTAVQSRGSCLNSRGLTSMFRIR